MSIRSSMILIVGAVIVITSFFRVISTNADTGYITIALGMILIALSDIMSEMESQTSILKNIEGEKGNIPDKIIEEKEGDNIKEA